MESIEKRPFNLYNKPKITIKFCVRWSLFGIDGFLRCGKRKIM